MMTKHQIKHLGIQVARQSSRVGVLLIMIAVVYLSLYAHYRAARAIEDEQLMTGFKGTVLKQIDRHVDQMDQPQAFLDGYKGTLWSMRVGGVSLSDPLAVAEVIATSKTVYLPFLASAVVPILATLLLGRVFCSWICPAGLLFALTDRLRQLLRLAEIKPAEVRFSHRNKYVVLAVGLMLAAIFGAPIFALIYPPAVISRLVHAWIFGATMTGGLIVLGVIVAIEVFVSPRWWCRTVCPGGALYGLFGFFRPLRIRFNARTCTGCGECEPACPMGLNPVRDAQGIECDNCCLCLRVCPEKSLYYTVGLPTKKRRPKTNRRKNGVVVAAVVFLLCPPPVQGHHILGLPHYSYKENYPQVPTLEYPATSGPYDILMTSYPGRPEPGESANVAFYIKDRNADVPFGSSITVRVLQTFTFGRSRVIVPATTVDPFDQTHKLSVKFPEAGEFVVELSLPVEGQIEIIPFLLIAGAPSATGSVLTAVGVGLVLFFIVVRAVKIKRDRRTKAEPMLVQPVA